MLEVCLDVAGQLWEPRVVICDLVAEFVTTVVEEEVGREPDCDARLTGCDRRTLRREPEMGSHLCYLAETSMPLAVAASSAPRGRRSRGRSTGWVHERVNPIIVTVGSAHTLRSAARLMSARGVDVAAVIDSEAPGPAIITARDILYPIGRGHSIDTELVGDHLNLDVALAGAQWPLERAAATMARSRSAHVVVIEDSDVVGILSIRDIVRHGRPDGPARTVATRASARP